MTEPSDGDALAASKLTAMPASRLERLVELYRETARSRTALVLLVANVIPIVGVLLLGWSLWTILAIYWVENGIVGLWNVPRILLAGGQLLPGRRPGAGYREWAVTSVSVVGRTAMAVFFSVHYGLFWLLHGVFVLVLPEWLGLPGQAGGAGSGPLFRGAPSSPFVLVPGSVGQASAGSFGRLDWSAVAFAAGGLFLSHGASFVFDYLRRGEFRRTWAAAQVVAPYGRVVVLHLTILLGGFAIAYLGAPLAMLVVLVSLKTALDLRLHLGAQRPPAIRMQAA